MISGQAFIDVSPAPKAKGHTTKYFLPEGQLNMAVFFVCIKRGMKEVR